MRCIVKGCKQPPIYTNGGEDWRLPSNYDGYRGTPMKGIEAERICYYHAKQRDGLFGEREQEKFNNAPLTAGSGKDPLHFLNK